MNIRQQVIIALWIISATGLHSYTFQEGWCVVIFFCCKVTAFPCLGLELLHSVMYQVFQYPPLLKEDGNKQSRDGFSVRIKLNHLSYCLLKSNKNNKSKKGVVGWSNFNIWRPLRVIAFVKESFEKEEDLILRAQQICIE